MEGSSARQAVDSGLASARWYQSPIDRDTLNALAQKRDWPAIRDTLIWLASMVLCAVLVIQWWPSWQAVFPLMIYGVLYGSASDSRWHECGHNTAFKTPWMNRVVYQIACFMIMRNPVSWRWSHTRHHLNTILVGRDPEIALMRPPDVLHVCLNFLGLVDAYHAVRLMFQNAFGRLGSSEQTYVPEREAAMAFRIARIWLLVYAGVCLAAVVTSSLLPLLLVGTPRLYGAWHHVLTGLLQHGGLADNVTDYRLNTRTVYMNRVSRFIYWNMNYHLEHHMYPRVPYHALPELHKILQPDMPQPCTSILAGYRQMLPVLWRQLKNEQIYLQRPLPNTASPYVTQVGNGD